MTFWKRVSQYWTKPSWNHTDLEALEEELLTSDLGHHLTTLCLKAVEKSHKPPLSIVKKTLLSYMTAAIPLPQKKPCVFMLVGVNGTGKTTVIPKLFHFYQEKNFTFHAVGADTFRIAAQDQLKEWATACQFSYACPSVTSSCSAAVQGAKAGEHHDILCIDTAGRLQNKTNLMEELEKIHRTLSTIYPQVYVLLVVDSTSGINAENQVESFQAKLPLHSLILTKLDTATKGGIIVRLQKKFSLPVSFISYGESPTDFSVFDPQDFLTHWLEHTTLSFHTEQKP